MSVFTPRWNDLGALRCRLTRSGGGLALVVFFVICSGVSLMAGEGKDVRHYLDDRGRFDLEAAREAGLRGALDVTGLRMELESGTGVPRFVDGSRNGSWSGDFAGGPEGVNQRVRAAAVYQGDLIVGGYFTEAGGVAANHIARWDGTRWHALGAGITGEVAVVFALAVYDDWLYVGGHFTSAGGSAAMNIARWNGSNWADVSYGTGSVYDIVYALHVWYDPQLSRNVLAVGGAFAWVGADVPPVSADNVARWDGSVWRSFDYGLNSSVHALCGYQGDLVAGGHFWGVVGGGRVNHMARWNGTSWGAVGAAGGTDGVWWDDDQFAGDVWALTVYEGELIVGGSFNKAGGAPSGITVWHVAAWDGVSQTWSAMGNGLDNNVYALHVFEGTLFAGGRFGALYGSPSPSHIARWNGTNWQGVDGGIGGGAYTSVTALVGYDDGGGAALIVGGDFSRAGDLTVRHVAAWSSGKGTWDELAAPGEVNAAVSTMLLYGGGLAVGGWFTEVGGVEAGRAALWDGENWNALGGGFDGGVRTLAEYNGLLIAGGDFTEAGGQPANHLAQWDGGSWQPVADGVPGTVYALAAHEGLLFVGGDFSFPGGTNLTSWDGQQWWGFAHAANDVVFSLASDGPFLYAGGWFTEVGGMPAERVARWGAGVWEPLGVGVDGGVYALCAVGGGVYAGGDFAYAGGQPASCIARWTGDGWASLGGGLSGAGNSVQALGAYGEELVVGGSFSEADGQPVGNIARWDGGSWSTFGGGMNDMVATVAAFGEAMYAGGYFTEAGDKSAPYIARWGEEAGPEVADACEDAIPLLLPAHAIGSTEEATVDAAPPCDVPVTAPGVWYRVTGTGTTITATTCNGISVYDTMLCVYTGSCEGLECVAGNDDACEGYNGLLSTVSWCSTLGMPYYILVHGYGGDTGVFELDVFDDGVPCAAPREFVPGLQLAGAWRSDAQWTDCDGDGDLDLVYAGLTPAGVAAVFCRNDDGVLVEVAQSELPGVQSESSGHLAWGDYDGDGDPDLALAGMTADETRIARVYNNDGQGMLTWDTSQELVGVALAAVAWGDYDNDGDVDLVISGHDGEGRQAILYDNGPLGTLTPAAMQPLVGLHAGSADFVDYDGDGDHDLVMTGSDGSSARVVFYRNDPVGVLTEDGDHGLPGVSLSDMAWADFDNDGDVDPALTGNTGSVRLCRVYENDGAGNFSLYAGGFPNIYRSSVAWGDYDNDGDADLAVCGYTGTQLLTRLYENTGDDFAMAAYPLPGVDEGALTWADVDQDGNLDLLIIGYYNWSVPFAQLYMNVGGVLNSAPEMPGALACQEEVDGVTLLWEPGFDAETAAAGLYYHLRVGTVPGGNDVCSGCRATPLLGNVGQSLSWRLQVPPGPYYASVWTVDAGLMVSEVAAATICADACGGQVLGDANCDGVVNNFDIDAFVLGLTQGQAAWEAAYGDEGCTFFCVNDINQDEAVNNFDIDPFVGLLTGG